jgi:iron(III) transport system substrate-binding protein
MSEDGDGRVRGSNRRQFLRAAAAAGIVGVAGCTGEESSEPVEGGAVTQIGSATSPFGDRAIEGGVSMRDMPDLAGELTLYAGRGEALVGELLSFVEELYPDFRIRPRYNSAADLVNQILTEGSNSPADVFFSVNAGSLGALKDEGRTGELPEEVLEFVPESFRDPDGQWVGTSGRARAIPYNTDALSASAVPDDVLAIPETEALQGQMGWAPTYSSFQAFVTAMRELEGDDRTREWLRAMLDAGVEEYSDEFLVSQAVADGELRAGFANHYYTLRVQAGREDAPIDLAFTDGDAGSVFNVAGALVTDTASDPELAANFVRHLLSAEAQDYFARTTFEYPLVPEVDPVGRLPRIDELNPPEGIDLTELSDLEGTIGMLREVGVL